MGAQRHFNGHAGAHVIAENFDDFTDRFGAAGWALGQFNHHHKAHARAHQRFRRDEDIKTQTAVVRDHKAHARVHKVAADNLRVTRHQHAHDARFTATFTVCAQRLRQHFIAVHAHFHLLARQVQIVLTPFNAQEAVTISVPDNHAFQQVQTLRQRVALAASEDQLPVALHRAQAAAKRFDLLFAFNVQLDGQFFTISRLFAFC